MDVLGFGLENYDAIGKWRTMDGKFPVDSSGTLPNGKSFSSPAELRGLLKGELPEFSRCLIEKDADLFSGARTGAVRHTNRG